MGVAEIALEAENAKAGRFLPRSRYWFGYALVALAYLAGTVVSKVDLDFWWRVGITIALFAIYTVIFSKFRKRSITQ